MTATFWIKALQLIVSLALLVFIHELGHFMWARFFKVRVEKFYLFFDVGLKKLGINWGGSILKFKPKNSDTEYGIGWLPLGGYCKISGMIDESMDTEQMKQPEQPWEFRSKPAWQRLLIMIGGVLNNFLLAIIIYAGMVYYWGEKYLPYKNAELGMEFSQSAEKIGFKDGDIPLSADGRELVYLNNDELQAILTAKQVKVLRDGKDTVTVNIPEKCLFIAEKDAKNKEAFIDYRIPVVVETTMPAEGAEKAGLKKGDHILSVDTIDAPDYKNFTAQLMAHKGKTVAMAFERNGKIDTANVSVNEAGKIGIGLRNVNDIFKFESKEYGLFASIPRGVEMGCTQMVNYVQQFKYVFSKEGAQSLGGFGAIGSIFPDTWNWYSFWNITAFLSIILAFMNILPIPALDGGHVLFLLYEIIFRRKPGDKFLERAQIVGMTILIALLLWANGNDIYRWIIKPFLE
ncbi:MAG: RIP metalloprotease RseP [Muribaculaceae bacterium]|nr:RIP metalloprotease RseP [Muribaculaceae bacterium]